MGDHIVALGPVTGSVSIDGCGDVAVGLVLTDLQPGSPWSVTAFSTPQSIGSGTVGASGVLRFTGSLPTLEPGVHHLDVATTRNSGSSSTPTLWFTVGNDGRVVATYADETQATSGYAAYRAAPATPVTTESANTGVAALPILAVAVMLLCLGIGLASIARVSGMATRRGRSPA